MHKKPRTKVLQIRLTASELKTLELAKEPTGTLARFAREKLLNQPASAQVVEAVATYADIVHHLKKIGTRANRAQRWHGGRPGAECLPREAQA